MLAVSGEKGHERVGFSAADFTFKSLAVLERRAGGGQSDCPPASVTSLRVGRADVVVAASS